VSWLGGSPGPGRGDQRSCADADKQLLNLHPLTLEDVLQQDPREKLDVFDKLGYYFVVFRAIDESYFKYTPGSASSGSGLTLGLAAATAVGLAAGTSVTAPEPEQQDQPEDKKESRRRGWGIGRAVGAKAGGGKGKEKVEIVEERPGKEGLEGVGVGAVNVYLAVFQDGIISVSRR
jgi:magnesium transporter